MPLSRKSLTIAAALMLGGTAAIAAPTATKPPVAKPTDGPTPTAAGDCPTPDKAKCLSVLRIDGEKVPYLETACGLRNKSACEEFVHDAIAAHQAKVKADTSLPDVEMLRPAQSNMPKHLTTGKYHKREASASRLKKDYTKLRKPYKKADDLLAGYGGMNMAYQQPVAREEHVAASDALKYWRNEGWKNNGPSIGTCKEYAYARSFTASRFIDAASACRGDRECVFDVAYTAGTGGISDRRLRTEDGQPVADLKLPTGKQAKNEMFPRGVEKFVRANGREEKLADTDAILDLEQALKEGQTFYELGSCSGNQCNNTRKFEDVWTWHTKMHQINATLSEAEAEEYEHRRAQFRRLFDQWVAAVAAEQIPEQRTEQEFVLPIDMRARDPFERVDLEQEYIERGRDQRIQLEKKFGKQIFQKSSVEALQQIRGAAQHGSVKPRSTPATAVFGMPAPTASKPKSEKKKKGDGPQASNNNFCVRDDLEWGLETIFQGPISCKMGKFLREEWGRHVAGQRSCLDPANPRCDWTMMTFEASVLAQLPALDAQVSEEAYCDAYLDGDTFKSAPGNIPNVTTVKARLDERRRIREQELANVSEYDQGRGDVGERLGKDWTGGDYAGDKESFGAGYDYDIGWKVEPATLVTAEGPKKGLVCEMKGSVHGDMSFDAHLVGKRFPIVSGSVRVRSRPGAGGHAEYNAHLKMFEMSLYQSEGTSWQGTQTFGDDAPVPMKIVEVPDVRPRFDVMVGPVPVSGQVWGELMFGSALSVGGTASTECNSTSPKFAVNGSYMPFFMATGNGRVGVGIAGLVSAGIRASLLLALIGTPVTFGMGTGNKDGGPTVDFTSEIDLLLATLGGRVSLYLEFLLYEEEFELCRWKGLSHTIELMKKTASVSWSSLK